MAPLIIPAWREDGVSHPMCPVAAVREFLSWTLNIGPDCLLIWLSSLSLGSCPDLARVLSGFSRPQTLVHLHWPITRGGVSFYGISPTAFGGFCHGFGSMELVAFLLDLLLVLVCY